MAGWLARTPDELSWAEIGVAWRRVSVWLGPFAAFKRRCMHACMHDEVKELLG